METIVEYLDSLKDDIEELNLWKRKLTYIPNIDKFYNLKILWCFDNNLCELPLLPNSLKYLYCYDNPLESFIPEKFWKQQNKKWLEKYLEKIIHCMETIIFLVLEKVIFQL